MMVGTRMARKIGAEMANNTIAIVLKTAAGMELAYSVSPAAPDMLRVGRST